MEEKEEGGREKTVDGQKRFRENWIIDGEGE